MQSTNQGISSSSHLASHQYLADLLGTYTNLLALCSKCKQPSRLGSAFIVPRMKAKYVSHMLQALPCSRPSQVWPLELFTVLWLCVWASEGVGDLNITIALNTINIT